VIGAVANDASDGKAYRKYGGSWQYASRVDHYRGGGAANGERAVHAVIHDGERAKPEMLTINEPDWSSDPV
jgi:hypothetical protein